MICGGPVLVPNRLSSYAERGNHFSAEAEKAQRSAALLGRLRLLTFFAGAIATWAAINYPWGNVPWVVLTALIAVYGLLVSRHQRTLGAAQRSSAIARFNRHLVFRLDRQWDALDAPPAPPVPEDHGYADDLDITGSASLIQLLGIYATPAGLETLTSWLSSPANPGIVGLRQEAVRELADTVTFREEMIGEAGLLGPGDADHLEQFLAWAEGEPVLLGRRRYLLWIANAVPVLNVIAISLYFLGLVSVHVVAWPLVVSSIMRLGFERLVSHHFHEVQACEAAVRQYTPLMSVILRSTHQSTQMADVRRTLGPDGGSADREIRKLRRILDVAAIRRSPFVHIPLATVFFVDVHVLAALESWRSRAGGRVRDWTSALGEVEALAAFGTISHAHPAWSFPHFDSGADSIHAKGLGHPLLRPASCVRNDVVIGPPGTFLLVTGSNMSGKSTLLRAIGVNVVLAHAGAPVCAESMVLPPLRLATSMRVRDSLSEGVSTFMAELTRLKRVVDLAEQQNGRTLYLLDEILQGTNTADRRVAARLIISRLLGSNAIGAVTTHDLTLADSSEIGDRAAEIHFVETASRDPEGLSFDYRIRPGPLRTSNALKLLQWVGLATVDSSPDHGADPLGKA